MVALAASHKWALGDSTATQSRRHHYLAPYALGNILTKDILVPPQPGAHPLDSLHSAPQHRRPAHAIPRMWFPSPSAARLPPQPAPELLSRPREDQCRRCRLDPLAFCAEGGGVVEPDPDDLDLDLADAESYLREFIWTSWWVPRMEEARELVDGFKVTALLIAVFVSDTPAADSSYVDILASSCVEIVASDEKAALPLPTQLLRSRLQEVDEGGNVFEVEPDLWAALLTYAQGEAHAICSPDTQGGGPCWWETLAGPTSCVIAWRISTYGSS